MHPPCSESAMIKRWQVAASSIPRSLILPVCGFRPDQNFAAWQGDKIIGAIAAKVLSTSSKQHTKTSATLLTSIAFSNSFFKENVDSILPDLHDCVAHLSDRNVGTIVEAAVCKIFQDDASAVEDLTRWLITKAEEVQDSNPKGRLLELGGRVDASTRVGGEDHGPLFQARAEFEGYTTTGEGTSKKKAEQNAAEKLLSIRLNNVSD